MKAKPLTDAEFLVLQGEAEPGSILVREERECLALDEAGTLARLAAAIVERLTGTVQEPGIARRLGPVAPTPFADYEARVLDGPDATADVRKVLGQGRVRLYLLHVAILAAVQAHAAANVVRLVRNAGLDLACVADEVVSDWIATATGRHP